MIEQAISSYEDEPHEYINGSYFGIEEIHIKTISDISDSLIYELEYIYGGKFFYIIDKFSCPMRNTKFAEAERICVRIYSGYKKEYKNYHSFLWNLRVHFDKHEVVSFSEIKELIQILPRPFDVAMNRAGIISPGAKYAREKIAAITNKNN